jgi:hypothetical protein
MKKRLFAMLLSALLLANVSACHYVSQNELDKTIENTDTVEFNSEKTTQTNDETEPQEDDFTNRFPSTEVVYTDVSVKELKDKLGCHLTTKCGKDRELFLSPRYYRFDVKQDPQKTNVFHITTQAGYTEYSTTVTLSKSYPMVQFYYNFFDSKNGYIMIFNMDLNAKGVPKDFNEPLDATELRCLLKTDDGGKTWKATEYRNPPTVNAQEYVTTAGFITSQIGFFSTDYSDYYDGNGCRKDFSERTFWTLDGGETWVRMSDACKLSFPDIFGSLDQDGQAYGTEFSDLTKSGNIYVMTVKVCHDNTYRFDGEKDLYIQYCSTDLKKWELIGKNEPIYVGNVDNLKQLAGLKDHIEDLYSFYNFINEDIGYFFIFYDYPSTRLKMLLKTEDGGISWAIQGFDCGLDTSWKEYVICAKMVDESVGLIATRHYADDYSKRIFVTADGGLTWSSVYIQLPWSETHLALGGEEVYDLLYESGKYVLYLRQRQDGDFVYFQYASTDLQNWTLVK